MDTQPVLVMHKICNYLDHDIEYIHLIMCCKKFYHQSKKYRNLYKFYKLSEIIKSVNKYNFINIIYDYPLFSIESIPPTIQTIFFIDNFNDNITSLYELPNLKSIQVGFGFTNIESVRFIPNNIINRKKLALKTIANTLAKHTYYDDIQRIYDNGINTYPRYFTHNSIYVIYKKILRNGLNFLKNKNIDVVVSKRILKIIKKCMNRWKSHDQMLSQLLLQIDSNNKYKSIFDYVNKITKHNEHIFLPFLNDNVNFVVELIEDLQFIFDQQKLFLEYIYGQIIKKHNCKDVFEYTDLCIELSNK